MTLTRFFLPILFALLTLFKSLSHTSAMDWRHRAESDYYLGYGMALLQGDGWLDCPLDDDLRCHPSAQSGRAYRLPGYPLFLTGLLVLFGRADPLPSMRMLQSVLAAALVFLTVGYAGKLRGSLAATGAGVFMLSVNYLYVAAALLITELLFALLIVLLVHLLTWRRQRGFALGALLGVLLLTRGVLLFTLPFLGLLIPRRQWPLVAVGALLVCVPWWIRNALVFQAFVPFSTGSGQVLWGANNAVSYAEMEGGWRNPPQLPGWDFFQQLPELEQDRAMSRAAWEWILAQDAQTLLPALARKWQRLFR